MNTKHLAALAVALCALGLIIYVATRPDGASHEPDGAADESAEASDRAGTPKRMSGSDAPAAASQQAPDIDEEPDPPGPLLLEGQVLDEQKAPVAGAKVWLGSNPPRSAETGQDGSFSFDKLIGKVYWISAKKGSRVGGPIERKLTRTSDPVVIQLELGAQVSVTVTQKSSGEPIAGATVALDSTETETTDGAGIARFDGVRPGYAGLSATADGYAPADSWMEIADNPGNEVSHQLELSRGAGVTGKVVDPDGKPVAGAKVLPIDSTRVFRAGSHISGTKTDNSGSFSIAAMGAGTWTFKATHKDFAPGASELITLDGKSAESGIEIQLEPGAIVAGRVVDKGDTPAPWASVRVQTRDQNGSGFGAQVRSTTADEHGEFEMTGLPRRKVRVLAIGETASSETVEVDLEAEPQTQDLTLTLDVTGKLAGVVVDAAGEPIAEAQVSAAPDFWSGESIEDFSMRGQAQSSTDGDGRFAFSGLPEGSYRVQANRTKGAAFWWSRPHGETARTGTMDIEIVLEKPGGITGKVVLDTGESPGAFTVEVGFPPAIPIGDKSGEFSISSQMPGTYDVTISGLEFSKHIIRGVEIAAGQTRDLGTIKVERGRYVTGRVTDASGSPVPGATVAIARQLIGDGTSLAPELGASTDQSLQMRRGRTDGDGVFRIVGIGKNKLVIAAEHPELGRSLPAEIPQSPEPAERDLQLRAFGSVRGIVTSGGKPASNIQVAATPKASSQQNIVVTTAADGTFRYDRLTEGTYTIMGILGRGIGGGNFASEVVEVAGGKEASVEIDIAVGDVELKVSFEGKDGAHVDAAQVFWFGRPGVEAHTVEDITRLFTGAGGSAKSGFAFSKDKPAKLDDVVPGDGTLCVLPINGSLLDPGFVQRLQEHANELRVYCEPLTVAPTPEEQSHTAVVPAMDPLPAPE